MLIVNQDKNIIVNTDKILNIGIEEYSKEIYCSYFFLDDIEPRRPWRESLGDYSTEQECKDVLKELKKCWAYGVKIFSMPECKINQIKNCRFNEKIGVTIRNGLCEGVRQSEYNDEPPDKCKRCKFHYLNNESEAD